MPRALVQVISIAEVTGTIALSNAVLASISLAPYILIESVQLAHLVSVGVTVVARFLFGYGIGQVTGINDLRSGLQTTRIGGLPAAAAFAIARLIG